MEEDEEYDSEAECTSRKGIRDGVRTGKVQNDTTFSCTMSENGNANTFIENSLPVENSREPVDCPRNSTDEGGITNDDRYAEEREVATSDEVDFIKRRVLQQIEELSARLASVETQMKTGSFSHKFGPVDYVQHETQIAPQFPPHQYPVFISPPLMPTQREKPSYFEEIEPSRTQQTPLLSQVDSFECSSYHSLAHDEADVVKSVDSNWPLLGTHGQFENIRSFEAGGKNYLRKNLSLMEYVRVEVLGADSHGYGDPQVWICLSILNFKKTLFIMLPPSFFPSFFLR